MNLTITTLIKGGLGEHLWESKVKSKKVKSDFRDLSSVKIWVT